MLNLWFPLASLSYFSLNVLKLRCAERKASSVARSIRRTVRAHASRESAKGGRGGEREDEGRGRDRLLKMMATAAEEIRNQTSPCPVPDISLSTLSIKITRKNQDRHWKLRFIYLQCCEYRHASRRLESNTGTGHTSPLKYWTVCCLTIPTDVCFQQQDISGEAAFKMLQSGWVGG